MRTPVALAVLFTVAAGPPALGSPPGEGGGAGKGGGMAPLAGPVVEELKRPTTLVERDFAGRIRRPETSPEAAAAALLELDEPTRGRVAEVLGERDALIDRLVRDNLDLLGNLASGEAAGAWEKLGVFQQVYQRLEPLRTRPPLRLSVRAALPADAAAEFDRLLDQYWDAIAEEGAGMIGADGRRARRWEAVVQERFESLGREFERSFQRMLYSGDLVYHILLDGMGLTPDQSERLRTIVGAFVERHGPDNASQADWARLGVVVMANLDETQRLEFIRRVQLLTAGRLPGPAAAETAPRGEAGPRARDPSSLPE